MKRILLLIPLVLLLLSAHVLAASTEYTVQRGDTLSQIARAHGVALASIIEHNRHISNPNLIFPGQRISIPQQERQSVRIATQDQHVSGQKFPKPVSAAEKDLLARIVHAEARGESFRGKVAVAHVVLNRVEDPRFPNTISGVIYQRGQFQPVSNGAINRPADHEAHRAVEEALNNRDQHRNSVFFYNPDIATSKWIFTRPTVKVIGNHVFAR